jgi:hypothetical protein
MSEWETDLENSAADFVQVVAPVLQKWSECENVSVEQVTEERIAEELDQTAGVDSWNIKHDDIIRGVASRVQYVSDMYWTNSPPDTFTIRKSRPTGSKTEFKKRLEAIRKGGLFPYWTTQAYLDEPGGELLSLARVRTEDLIRYINDGDADAGDYYTKSPKGEASFFVVDWWRLKDDGIGVKTEKPYESSTELRAKADASQVGLSDFMTDGGNSDD